MSEEALIDEAKHTDNQIIHRALKMIAGTCDGASRRDDTGFSKFDVVKGKALAFADSIEGEQLYGATQLAHKYRRQLPDYMREEVDRILTQVKAPTFDIETVPWSEARIVPTRSGPKRVREWFIPPGSQGFWDEWKKGIMRRMGYTVSKWKGDWKLTEWRKPEGGETEQTQRAVAALDEVEREDTWNANYEPELPALMQSRFDDIEPSLLAYQRPSVKRLATALNLYDGGVDLSDTGTGKTFVALGACRTLGMKAFVICPKSVIPSWKKAAKFMGVNLIAAINYEMLRTGKTGAAFWDWIEETPTGKKLRRPQKVFRFNENFLDKEDVVLIFDEIHRMKDYTTQNCAMGIGAIAQGYKVVGLSATAADNPMQMKFSGWLSKLYHYEKQFFGWMLKNGVRRGRWGYEFVGGKKVLSDIHRQILPTHGTRIRIADLGDQFPETQINAEAYEMNGATEEIQAVYEEMHREIAKLEASEAHDRGANILTEMLRARQRTELLKVPTICNMAEDGIAEGMSVIVICNFEDSLQAIAARLKTNAIIHGGQNPENRQAIIDEFNADNEQVIVMNIRAGGVGISLHGFPNSRMRLSLISPTFSGIDLKQAFGRPWRAGGARSIQKVIFAAGTIEEDACEKVRDKIKRIDMINDGELEQALRF